MGVIFTAVLHKLNLCLQGKGTELCRHDFKSCNIALYGRPDLSGRGQAPTLQIKNQRSKIKKYSHKALHYQFQISNFKLRGEATTKYSINRVCGREEAIVKKKSMLLIFLLLFVALVSYRLIRQNLAKTNVKEPPEKVTVVKVLPAGRGNIEEIISLNGDVHGLREVDVYTRVSGKLIRKVRDEGENVKKGEIIALVDRDEPALGFTKAEVRAPISGTIVRYYVDIGDSVIPQEPMPQEPVLNIAYMDKVKIVVNIGEKDISKLRKGEKVRVSVDAYPGETFPGRVVKIAPAVDPRSRKLKVELEIENEDHRLKPGMFADVEIIYNEHKNVLVVPAIAVLERGEKKVLFTAEDGRARLKEVQIGVSDKEKIEIIEGLSEGESVIVEGNYGLPDGAKVELGGS